MVLRLERDKREVELTMDEFCDIFADGVFYDKEGDVELCVFKDIKSEKDLKWVSFTLDLKNNEIERKVEDGGSELARAKFPSLLVCELHEPVEVGGLLGGRGGGKYRSYEVVCKDASTGENRFYFRVKVGDTARLSIVVKTDEPEGVIADSGRIRKSSKPAVATKELTLEAFGYGHYRVRTYHYKGAGLAVAQESEVRKPKFGL